MENIIFTDGQIVKIKPEWCESDNERKSFYITMNCDSDRKTCQIGLVEADKLGFPFGLINNVSMDMLILA